MTLRVLPALLLIVWIAALHAQNPTAQGAGPASAAQGPPPPDAPARPASGVSPASKRPAETRTPQAYPAEQVQAGRGLFAAQCGFCHGRDAAGGESGPDLTRSSIVTEDARGDKIAPLLRGGRVEKGMPAFNLSEADLAAIVAFIHNQKTEAESQLGGRRTVDLADLQTGSVEAGRQYFNGAGGCSKCHSPSRDFAGLGSRVQGFALLQRMLYPGSDRSGTTPAPATVTVTLASGKTLTGKLAYRDEFTIALTDASGWYRSWQTSQVKFAISNPLDGHIEQLGRYTDDDMHNVLAYLQTLR